ncbi:MAG: hypothetical protein PHT16_00645 [Candidatus Pacebacteria bacterium]|nr:hypothetical protein [Candidatus Paceibacterota bacterium]
MTEKSKKLIQEEMLNLPKEAQDAINASNWEKQSEEIGKKYLLNEDEIYTFQLETACFLLGLIDEDQYQKNIEDGIGTSKAEAEKISEEVIQKILIPINDLFVKNIKKSDKVKNATAEQNLNFILSGGDYTAFLDVPPLVDKEGNEGRFLTNSNSPHPDPLLSKERGNTEETVLPAFFIKK